MEGWYLEAPPKASVEGATTPATAYLVDHYHVRIDHVTVFQSKIKIEPTTLSGVMDARERLEVENEDERQSRLGADPPVHL